MNMFCFKSCGFWNKEKCLCVSEKTIAFQKVFKLHSVKADNHLRRNKIHPPPWVRREWAAVGMVVKLLQPSYCSTSVHIKLLFDTVSSLSNRLTGTVWHSDQKDHRIGEWFTCHSLWGKWPHKLWHLKLSPIKGDNTVVVVILFAVLLYYRHMRTNLLRHCFWVGRSPSKAAPLLNRVDVPQSGAWGIQAQRSCGALS